MMSTRAAHRSANPLRPVVWGGAAVLLLLPALAMQLSDEVRWSALDFVVFGALLASAGGLYELAARRSGHPAYRAGAALAVGAGFLMAWANLAVGIIGNEDAPVNLAFFGVLAFGLVGAVVARFRARGLAWVLVAMALLQSLVYLVSGAMGLGQAPWLAWGFAGAWLVAAGLFGWASKATA